MAQVLKDKNSTTRKDELTMLRDELQEMQATARERSRIAARDEKIKKMLAEDETKTAEAPAPAPANDLVPYDQDRDGTVRYRKLKPWERIDAKGRVEQYRPMTAAEVEAETERAFLKQQFEADQAHGEKVSATIREAEREQKDMDKRREREARTGKRPYNDGRFITLEEAERRGLIGNGSSDNDGEEYGLFASGGRVLGSRRSDNGGGR